MEMTLYKNLFHNCLHLIMSSMLQRRGVDLDAFWFRAGLVYKDTEGMPILSPYYRRSSDDLLEYHGISYIEQKISSTAQLMDKLNELLQSGHTVGITADIFELPYCPYYQGHHETHMFEVVGYEDGEYLLCDHYYHFAGRLLESQLRAAVECCYSVLQEPFLRIFHMEGGERVQRSDQEFVRQVIRENSANMSGKSTYELDPELDGAILGVAAIPLLKEKIATLPQLDQDAAYKLIDHLFIKIKELGNSRNNLYVFLNHFGVRDLALALRDASQDWTVTGNLLLRCQVVGHYDALPRVLARLDRTMRQEEANLKMMMQYLEG